MSKIFTLTIELRENDCPQHFEFRGGVSPLEQLAIWTLIENLAKVQKENMLKPAPISPNYIPPKS